MKKQITFDEAVENLRGMFPNISSESISIALKANSTLSSYHEIENSIDATIDFLLSHEAEKAVKLSEEATSAKPPSVKGPEEKLDLDMLLAMELQREEMESKPQAKKPPPPEKPRKAPPPKKHKDKKASSEGKEYVFIHNYPVGTFVCMYPELLLKEEIKSAPPAESGPKAEVKKGSEEFEVTKLDV